MGIFIGICVMNHPGWFRSAHIILFCNVCQEISLVEVDPNQNDGFRPWSTIVYGSIWKVRKPCKFHGYSSSFFPLPLSFDLDDLDSMPPLFQTDTFGRSKTPHKEWSTFVDKWSKFCHKFIIQQVPNFDPYPRWECTEILYKILSMMIRTNKRRRCDKQEPSNWMKSTLDKGPTWSRDLKQNNWVGCVQPEMTE